MLGFRKLTTNQVGDLNPKKVGENNPQNDEQTLLLEPQESQGGSLLCATRGT